jgi:cbb3-type cytochrome oxidase cytochrome c subunit/mono/diheme cytochrome c family protein
MSSRTAAAIRTSYLAAAISAVALFGVSVLALAVWPGRILDRQTRSMSPEHLARPTASEQRGRLVYGREGCVNCHTQQIRFVAADARRFGPPTLAWETQFDYPHLWGTRRIGPDLAREGGGRSDDWHYAHLFAPRAIVPSSVMPAYRHLFEARPDRPTLAGRDLVAYLQSLGRAGEISAAPGAQRLDPLCNCSHDELHSTSRTADIGGHPAKARAGDTAPVLPPGLDRSRGMSLYGALCAGCHGVAGFGNGPAASSLKPAPAALAEHEYSRSKLAAVLWNGVPGTAMPAWRDRSRQELSELADVVRGLVTDVQPPTGAENRALGSKVYQEHCAQCHGRSGDGRGSAAGELLVRPTDFTSTRPTTGRALTALRTGVRGTRMGVWAGRLSEEELQAVVAHLRSLFVSGGT